MRVIDLSVAVFVRQYLEKGRWEKECIDVINV